MDLDPGDLPEKAPKLIWVCWDSCGEFLDATCEPEDGARWVEQAKRGCGYTATYTLNEVVKEEA